MPIDVWQVVVVGCSVVLVGVAVLCAARTPALRCRASHAPQVAVPAQDRSVLYQNEKWIPLTEASRIMYDALDGTAWRTMADQETTPVERLNFMAGCLIRHAPIDGRSPPSTTHKRIPSGDFDAGIIKGGGQYFQRHYESFLTFLDMRIKEADLQGAIVRMKAGE